MSGRGPGPREGLLISGTRHIYSTAHYEFRTDNVKESSVMRGNEVQTHGVNTQFLEISGTLPFGNSWSDLFYSYFNIEMNQSLFYWLIPIFVVSPIGSDYFKRLLDLKSVKM